MVAYLLGLAQDYRLAQAAAVAAWERQGHVVVTHRGHAPVEVRTVVEETLLWCGSEEDHRAEVWANPTWVHEDHISCAIPLPELQYPGLPTGLLKLIDDWVCDNPSEAAAWIANAGLTQP